VHGLRQSGHRGVEKRERCCKQAWVPGAGVRLPNFEVFRVFSEVFWVFLKVFWGLARGYFLSESITSGVRLRKTEYLRSEEPLGAA
jgi:hypothetical protein